MISEALKNRRSLYERGSPTRPGWYRPQSCHSLEIVNSSRSQYVVNARGGYFKLTRNTPKLCLLPSLHLEQPKEHLCMKIGEREHIKFETVHTIVFRPEGEIPPPDNILEHESDDHPRYKIYRSSWWQQGGAAEQDAARS